MKQLTYIQVANLCGFKAKESMKRYIESGVFPQPTNREFNVDVSKNKPYFWDEDVAIKGAERVAQDRKEKAQEVIDNRISRKKEKKAEKERNSPTLRELAEPKKRELKGFDKAMKLMKAR